MYSIAHVSLELQYTVVFITIPVCEQLRIDKGNNISTFQTVIANMYYIYDVLF